jgi:hypothetical protein
VNRLVLCILVFALAGCATAPEIKPVTKVDVVENTDKDLYIDWLEAEIGEAAGAIKVVGQTLPEGNPKAILTLTYNRLSGIMEPTVAEIEKYQKALKDAKTLEVESAKAKETSEESTRLYAKVEATDTENKSLKRQLDLVNAQREQEAKEKAIQDTLSDITKTCKWVGAFFLLACLGMVFVSRYATASICGGIGLGLIMAPIFVPTIMMNPIFQNGIMILLLIGVVYGMWLAKKHSKPLDKPLEPVKVDNDLSQGR